MPNPAMSQLFDSRNLMGSRSRKSLTPGYSVIDMSTDHTRKHKEKKKKHKRSKHSNRSLSSSKSKQKKSKKPKHITDSHVPM